MFHQKLKLMMSPMLTANNLKMNVDLKPQKSIFQPLQNDLYGLVLCLLENYDQNVRFSMKEPYFSRSVLKGNISQLWFIENLMRFDASCSSSLNRNSSSKNHSFHQLTVWLFGTCGFAVFRPASVCRVGRSGLHLGTEVLAETRHFSLSCWLK